MRPVVSLDGQFIADRAALSPFDRGLLLGDGLFETLKVTAEQGAWYLSRHLDRLRSAAHTIGLVLPPELPQWIEAVVTRTQEQLQEQVAADATAPSATLAAGLRITITRGGDAPSGLAGMDHTPPRVFIATFDAPITPDTAYTNGISAHLATGRRNERSMTAGLKTTSYIDSVVALRAARAGGYDDALFLDTRGFVSEATASNVFVVLDDAVVTPSKLHGILPGITREVVLELAQHLGIPAVERELGLQELLDASEAFLTSSLRGIIPLVRVGEDAIHGGTPGAMTHRIAREYAALTPRV